MHAHRRRGNLIRSHHSDPHKSIQANPSRRTADRAPNRHRSHGPSSPRARFQGVPRTGGRQGAIHAGQVRAARTEAQQAPVCAVTGFASEPWFWGWVMRQVGAGFWVLRQTGRGFGATVAASWWGREMSRPLHGTVPACPVQPRPSIGSSALSLRFAVCSSRLWGTP